MKQLIFDFDGTLVDSMPAWGGKMLNILKVFGVEYPADIIKTVTPLGDRGTAEYFLRTFGIRSTPEELIAMMDAYAQPAYSERIPAKETVLETLTALRAQGYHLSVLTASPHRMLDVCLQRVGLYPLFDHVWSCDDFGTTKGDVGIYRAVAEQLGDRVENCVFLDDNIHALTVAKAAGMAVVGVYDDSAADAQEDIAALAYARIDRMAELPAVLETLTAN